MHARCTSHAYSVIIHAMNRVTNTPHKHVVLVRESHYLLKKVILALSSTTTMDNIRAADITNSAVAGSFEAAMADNTPVLCFASASFSLVLRYFVLRA